MLPMLSGEKQHPSHVHLPPSSACPEHTTAPHRQTPGCCSWCFWQWTSKLTKFLPLTIQGHLRAAEGALVVLILPQAALLCSYLSWPGVNAVGVEVAAPSALQHAVVYGHTVLAIPSPAHVALAGGSARACAGAQGLQEKGERRNYTQQKGESAMKTQHQIAFLTLWRISDCQL